jgi:hypothetical protein
MNHQVTLIHWSVDPDMHLQFDARIETATICLYIKVYILIEFCLDYS